MVVAAEAGDLLKDCHRVDEAGAKSEAYFGTDAAATLYELVKEYNVDEGPLLRLVEKRYPVGFLFSFESARHFDRVDQVLVDHSRFFQSKIVRDGTRHYSGSFHLGIELDNYVSVLLARPSLEGQRRIHAWLGGTILSRDLFGFVMILWILQML